MKKYLFLLIPITILFACKKEITTHNNNAILHFSNDTISFDTIFTSIGSITKTLTVYNRNEFNVTSNIAIKGNSTAYFRMNINGTPGNNQNNIEIVAGLLDNQRLMYQQTLSARLNIQNTIAG